MFIGGICITTYASYYAPRASIGKEISVYTYFFPNENFFSNIIATFFGGIICLIATSMAIGEIKRRKAFIEIDDDFISWQLMQNKKNHLIRVHKDDIAKIELVYDLPKTSKDQKASKNKDSKDKQKGSSSYFKRFIFRTRTEKRL